MGIFGYYYSFVIKQQHVNTIVDKHDRNHHNYRTGDIHLFYATTQLFYDYRLKITDMNIKYTNVFIFLQLTLILIEGLF